MKRSWHLLKRHHDDSGPGMSGFWDIYIARSRVGIYYLKIDAPGPEDPDAFHEIYPGEVGTELELLDFISKEMCYIEVDEIVKAVQGIRGFGKLCRMIEDQFKDNDYMKATQLNQIENDKLQEQSIDIEAAQVRSVINRGLAKNRKEALKLLDEAPF